MKKKITPQRVGRSRRHCKDKNFSACVNDILDIVYKRIDGRLKGFHRCILCALAARPFTADVLDRIAHTDNARKHISELQKWGYPIHESRQADGCSLFSLCLG